MDRVSGYLPELRDTRSRFFLPSPSPGILREGEDEGPGDRNANPKGLCDQRGSDPKKSYAAAGTFMVQRV